MKVEKEKTGLYLKGSAEVYHSVTYMYGYQRFFGFSVDGSFYQLEENQDKEGRIRTRLTEVSSADFQAMLARYQKMTKRWRNKKNLKTFREDYRDQVVEFGHDCKKQLLLRKDETELFSENSFNSLLESCFVH